MKRYLVYKNEVQGLSDVLETIKTIEKIAASNIHFLKKSVQNLELYTDLLNELLGRFTLFYKPDNCFYLRRKNEGKKCLLILSSDKGLVGDLWHSMFAQVFNSANQYSYFLIVGRKGERFLEEKGKSFKSFSFSEIPQKEEVKNLFNYLVENFKNKVFSQIDILYPHFVSLIEQRAQFSPFLPIRFCYNLKGKEIKQPKIPSGLPIFEPSAKKIFNWFLERYRELYLTKIIMEWRLSEFSARTVSAEEAAKKSETLIKRFRLAYFKSRKKVITQKQLESFSSHQVLNC